MDTRSADYADLCKRWPRLIAAYNAQTSAYGELDAVARKYDYEMTIANLELAKIGLA